MCTVVIKAATIEEFANGSKLFIAGSTWPADEKIIADLIATNPGNWKFVIPRTMLTRHG